MKPINKMMIGVILSAVAGYAAAAPTIYGFYRITSNGTQDVAGQLSVQVSEVSAAQVQFDFFNTGSVASVVTAVFLDDASPAFLTSVEVINGSGVSFDWAKGKKFNFPSGEVLDPVFETDVAESADAASPAPSNGINPGETLGLLFNGSYGNVIAALNDGSLRIGLHVQGIGSGGKSESYVNTPIVPAPGALLLASMGLGLVGHLRRRTM